jgi:uroporphyrinogen decarboxylase
VKAGRKDNAPILQTLFSPLTVAAKLSGPELLLQTLRGESEVLLAALEVITETMISYARASFEAGAEGFFYATQMATRDRLSLAEHRKFAEPYDLRILKNISLYSSFNLLHIHGENIFFQELSGYPVQAINWHDRMTPPTLGEGQKIFSGAVVGGLEEWGILMSGPESSIHAQIQEAILQTGGRRLIIAPGCGLPIDLPEPFLQAARRAAEGK